MTTYACLQAYWWLLISVLGALLVFLLFVQGGQTFLCSTRNATYRTMEVNSIGRKWELTFTVLVVFGGAFFASFPLFYSTSFGGAYWLWMLILFSFVAQAVSYEYRRKPGNLYGTGTYDILLLLNGCFGCVLLGVAVGMMFFGAEFEVVKGNLLDSASPVISRWAPSHGFEAIANWRNLLLGFTVLMLARTQASLYFINNIDDAALRAINRRRVLYNGAIFVLLFLIFVCVLLTATGYQTVTDPETGAVDFVERPFKYFWNYVEMWWCFAIFIIGVLGVLYAVLRSALDARFTTGIWYSGLGTVFVVLSLLFVAGYNDTPYYPSTLDPASSLTIANSSSSEFTLTVMSWVSILVPFVLAYIWYVWRKMDAKPITEADVTSGEAKY